MSPAVEARQGPLCASTPLVRGHMTNGHDRDVLDNRVSCDTINGNVVDTNALVRESISMDVLSGGESDAGDTLNWRNNNSISSTLCVAGAGTEPRRGRALQGVADELLNTERTYKRDLELVTVTWSTAVSGLSSVGAASDAVSALARCCLALGPLALGEGALLAKLDRTTGPDSEPVYKKIDDILYEYLSNMYDAYQTYIASAGGLIAGAEAARRRCSAAAGALAAFDGGAPLPLGALLLRPLHRLIHLRALAQELVSISPSPTAVSALELSCALSRPARRQLRHAEAHAALCRLQRLIPSYPRLLAPGRDFLRCGTLLRHSPRGPQLRMLFLFNDLLLICCKAGGGQFRAQHALPLPALSVRRTDEDLPHCFTLTAGEVTLVLTASNEPECEGWLRALTRAQAAAPTQTTHADTRDTDTSVDEGTITEEASTSAESGGGGVACGAALAVVCWHRGGALGRAQLRRAMRTQMSGCLLRKFKNSVGWQKLWVVFAAASLLFYKSWRDEAPLASLPLLGYTVGPPLESDGINKDFVFKLQFKNHVYFFRANSQYTYDRWIAALRTAMTPAEESSDEDD